MQVTNPVRRDASRLEPGGDIRRSLELGLGGCCAFLLMGLVFLTVVDVVGRYVLTAPLPGAFELTELMLGALVFAALPLATRAGEHVAVDALFDASPPRVQTALAWLGSLASAAALWVIAWRLAVHSLRLADDEAVTDALLVPLAPLGWFGAAMAALSGLLAVAGLRGQDSGTAGRQPSGAQDDDGRASSLRHGNSGTAGRQPGGTQDDDGRASSLRRGNGGTAGRQPGGAQDDDGRARLATRGDKAGIETPSVAGSAS